MIFEVRRLFGALLLALCFVSLFSFADENPADIEIKNLQGQEAKPYLEKLSNFYSSFFQNSPFRDNDTKAEWDARISSLFDNPASISILVMKNGEILGAAMGMPLKDADASCLAAFDRCPQDLNSLFFIARFAVKKECLPNEYLPPGIVETTLRSEFERLVRQKKLYSGICLWLLDSISKNPDSRIYIRWKQKGFSPHPEFSFEDMWKEDPSPEAKKVPHKLVLWKKELQSEK
jgi:hypothetical protein